MPKIWRCKKNYNHKNFDKKWKKCQNCGDSLQVLCSCDKCVDKDGDGQFQSYSTYISHNPPRKKIKTETNKETKKVTTPIQKDPIV